MALKGKTKSFKEEEERKKGKNTGSAGINLSSGNAGSRTVTQPVVPGLPRAGNRGQVAGAASSIISQNYGPSKLSAGKAPAPSLSSFAAAGYRAGSSLRTSGAMGGVTAWSPPKPTLSYEQAAETAERLYGEYNQKKTAFDERYGGLEHPEMYYGWKQRGDELTALEERYGKMLDHMNRHYMEMEVEPSFTFSGTAADVTPYQQQIDQMRGELEAYVSASNGLPDPSYVRQQQTNIARLQAALDTLPEEQDIPKWLTRIGKIGLSAGKGMAADYAQIYSTGMQVYDELDSTDGPVEQLLVSMAQYTQERDAYLQAGISQNHIVIENLNAVIHDLENQLAFYSGEGYQRQINALVRESEAQANELYAAADDARNRAVDGLGTVGTYMVDAGIAGIKMLTDAAVGAITGIPGAALASSLIRSFGQGAHEGADKNLDVYGQIGNGIKSVAIDYATSKMNAGNEVYDSAVKAMVQNSASRLGQNPSVVQMLASYSLHSLGEGLVSMVGHVFDPLCDAIMTGNIEWSEINDAVDAGIESYLLSIASGILDYK